MKTKLALIIVAAIVLLSFTVINSENSNTTENKKDIQTENSKPSEGFALEDRGTW
jgi:uncharacterized secreted protein with C-terminal beta-propeller domain